MAYAITAQHLFDVRLVIRRAFVLAVLVALGVELYELVLNWLVRYLPVSDPADRRLLATALVLTINALTQDEVRKLLSRTFDRMANSEKRSQALHMPSPVVRAKTSSR